MLARVAETQQYKEFTSLEKQELVSRIQQCDDLEVAISLRLAYIAADTSDDPAIILVNQVTAQQAVLQEQILKNYRGVEIIDQVKKNTHEATRVIVYAANSDERLEQELKE